MSKELIDRMAKRVLEKIEREIFYGAKTTGLLNGARFATGNGMTTADYRLPAKHVCGPWCSSTYPLTLLYA